ncbi:hypothetical protein M404DRAFT_34373 [Pisolithus tinctorius Marx 270]|uniref:Uncharacterized protein n=1 Tax=Pisolithus tinctorius Marx 270 TaxID=870435 RepID=A0A0C3NIE1_PISTI|nr:hypothetical protein M404DRAFT_34373 [Pisolithus tinctorius Marx 270]
MDSLSSDSSEEEERRRCRRCEKECHSKYRSPSTEAQELRRRMAQPEELSEGQHILRLLGQGTLALDKPKPLKKMPSRSLDKAPKFSGKTADLVHYLEEIHHLCKKAGCTDEYEWLKWAIWYLDNDTANLWTQLVEEMTGRWDKFIESRKIIATEEDLGEYLRQYETIVGYLNRCYKLTQEDYDGYIWEGLDPELQKDTLENLKFRNGLHDSDDPWPMNKFNDGTHVPRTDEPMYQLIDKWMARDRRRREEQQVPIIRIEHEEDPPTNMNMFIAAHNAFQYIERARSEEYGEDGEDMAEEVILETEYEFDGVAVPGKERQTATLTAEQPGPSWSDSTDAPEASLKDKGKQPDRSTGGTQGPTSAPKAQPHVTEDQDAGRKGYRYTSLFEDPTAAMRVLNQYLDQSVMIPGRDLLAISPDVWREFKDRAMKKRVVLSATCSGTSDMLEGSPRSIDVRVFECSIGDERYMQMDSMPLMMVEVELAGKVKLEGILNSSLQIVALRQEITEVLCLPIERDSRIIMEAANQSKDEMLGLV